jgi:hypothetical protein
MNHVIREWNNDGLHHRLGRRDCPASRRGRPLIPRRVQQADRHRRTIIAGTPFSLRPTRGNNVIRKIDKTADTVAIFAGDGGAAGKRRERLRASFSNLRPRARRGGQPLRGRTREPHDPQDRLNGDVRSSRAPNGAGFGDGPGRGRRSTNRPASPSGRRFLTSPTRSNHRIRRVTITGTVGITRPSPAAVPGTWTGRGDRPLRPAVPARGEVRRHAPRHRDRRLVVTS